MKPLFYFHFVLAAALALPQHALANKAYDSVNPLTEQEEKEAETYIHKGKADRIHHELCADNPEKCRGQGAWDSDSTMSKVDHLMPIVTKAYSVFSMGTQMNYVVEENDKPIKIDKDKNEYKWQPGEDGEEGKYVNAKNPQEELQLEDGKTAKDLDNKTEKKTDYCGKIPPIIEVASIATQSASNEQTQANYSRARPEAQEKAGLESLAKMHDDRASTAVYQAAGWGAVAGCYAVAMMSFNAAGDFTNIAKLAGATVIAGFYTAKVGAHKDKAKTLRKMAKEFPGAGDCNPHTDTTCFCSEESSYASDPTNFMKYCVPAPLHRDGEVAGYSCVDKEGKADLNCACKKTNSCVNARLASQAFELGLNPATMQNPLAGLEHLSKGHADGRLGEITQRNLAMAQKALKDWKPREKLNIGNNPKAKELTKSLMQNGIPAAAAATLASGNWGEPVDSLPGEGAFSLAALKPTNDRNAAMPDLNKGKNKMESGGTLKSKSQSRSASSPFARRGSSGARTSSVDILSFASEASAEAQIAKDTSRPIFEIITYRYKMRAWKEFKDEMQQHLEEEPR